MTQQDRTKLKLNPYPAAPTYAPTTVATSATTVHVGRSSNKGLDLLTLKVNNSTSAAISCTLDLGTTTPQIVKSIPAYDIVDLLDDYPVENGTLVSLTGTAAGLRAFGTVTEKDTW